MLIDLAGARASGPELEHVRSNLFDFVWTLRAAMKANLFQSSSRYWPWLNDLLSDVCDGCNWLQPEEVPAVLHGWRRTDRSIKPVTIRGIDWEQLAASNARSADTVDISPPRSKEEMLAVLEYPHLEDTVMFDTALTDDALFRTTLFDTALFDTALTNTIIFVAALRDAALFHIALFDTAMFDAALFDTALLKFFFCHMPTEVGRRMTSA